MSGEIELEEISSFGNPSDVNPLLHHHQIGGSGSPASVAITAPSLRQMNYEDVEAGGMAACRICLDSQVKKDDAMISPCMCKGSLQFVHRACLDHWRSIKEGFAFSHCTVCRAQYHLKVVKLSSMSWPKMKFRLFVTRDVFLVFMALQMVIGLIGVLTYAIYNSGYFETPTNPNWVRILSAHPLPLYYCIGVVFSFALIGLMGLILHCMSCTKDPRIVGLQNLCFGWAMLDCFPFSFEICFTSVIIVVVIFAILGFAYGFLAATVVIQRIWQRYYHILTKRELTKEYVVEDLHGCYTPPELTPEHLERLGMLKLM